MKYIDQQDDPGFIWDELSHLWPEGVDVPAIGKAANSGIIKVAGVNRYCVETPEDTLMSILYFESGGKDNFDDDEQRDIRIKLAHAAEWHDMEYPEVDFDMDYDEPAEEVYADENSHLPVTTPEQLSKSASLFLRNEDRFPTDERIVIYANLKTAADHHGVDLEIPYDGSLTLSRYFDTALDLRKESMKLAMRNVKAEFGEDFEGLKLCESYLDFVDNIDKDQPVYKIASQLERWDVMCDMQVGWYRAYPDPIASVLVGVPPAFEKKSEWDGRDYSVLDGVFDPDVVEAIKDNPEVVIPSLPHDEQNIIRERLKNGRV